MSAPDIVPPGGGGGGGGGISGSGTPGNLAKFTGATALGDSLLSESGTTITSAATAEMFGSAQTWTIGAPNSQALVVLSNAGAERTLVLDTIGRAVGVGTPFGPGTLLHVHDGNGAGLPGSLYEGVRLQRATEAIFSSSDYTRSFRAGITGGTAIVGTSTAHDLLLQRGNVTAATLQNGAIATVTLTAGGTGYTSATYAQQALTGGTGSGATADIVVEVGVVTSCVVRSPGTGYAAADALSCATIGAGAGFILTVATTAAIVAGSGNLTALGRIGAGTATPRAALDAVGGTFFSGGSGVVADISTAAPAFDTNKQYAATAVIGTVAVDGALTGYNSHLINPLNVVTSAQNIRGIYTSPRVISAGAGNGYALHGIVSSAYRIDAADVATGPSLYSGRFTVGVFSSGSATTTALYGVSAQIFHNQAAHTTATATFYDTTASFTTGTISTLYGLRLRDVGVGTTVTNRWGISQEDTLARNVFSGATVIGAAAGTSPATGSKLDVLGLTANRAAGTYTIQPTTWWAGDVCAQLVIDSTAETGGLTKPTTAPGYVAAITSIPRYDLSLRGTTAVYGIQSQPLLEAATLTGTSNVTAIDGNVNLNQSGITAKTVALVGVSGGASIATVGATVTASLIGVGSTVANFATTAVAHSLVAQFLGNSSTFSGAAHTITNFYGVRLRTTTLSGGATITNRWGISQEDALANNVLAGNTVMGAAAGTVPTATLDVRGNGTVTGNLSFNSGYGSAAVAYGCRAWVNFNGTTTITIRASGGISSITRTSGGVYVTNLSVTMPDANYSAIATKQNVSTNVSCGFYDLLASRTTTAATWNCVENAIVQDAANINIAFFR